MVLVDDDERNLAFNEHNAIKVEKFASNMGSDEELSRIMETLREIAKAEDV